LKFNTTSWPEASENAAVDQTDLNKGEIRTYSNLAMAERRGISR